MAQPCYRLGEIPDAYVDAVVTQSTGEILFMSVWGTDTVIKELIGRLSVNSSDPLHIGESALLPVNDAYQQRSVYFGSQLTKETARVPNTLFGKLVHLWLIDKRCVEPDLSNHRAYLLQEEGHETDQRGAFWELVKMISPVPLLDHWQPTVLQLIEHHTWSEDIEGVGVTALSVDLSSQEYIDAVCGLARDGLLQSDHSANKDQLQAWLDEDSSGQAGLFDGAPIVSSYSRAQMIDDGMLIDVTELARPLGFRVPVGITAAAWGCCIAVDQIGANDELIAFLQAAFREIRNVEDGSNKFRFKYPEASTGTLVEVISHIGPGDAGEPVITLMRPEDD